jgi:hypothetical protein
MLLFTLACGSTYTSASNNNWLTTNTLAALGQINAVAATTDVFRLTGVIVLPGNEGPSAARSPFIMRPFPQELELCKRYWQKSYNYASLPGSVGSSGSLFHYAVTLATVASGGSVARFGVSMRAAPTVVAYSPSTGAAGKIADNNSPGTDISVNVANQGETGFHWYGSSATTGLNLVMHYTADARL